MLIAQYFVEFIFYSFLGWVWESIFCTIKRKQWQDRGFLFGPICPIYGSCVVALDMLSKLFPSLSDESFPLWGIFLICMAGSAIAEFSTSWVLEKRFHAMWWDYSKMPLNLQGRICLPISIAFGLTGVVVFKLLIPYMNGLHTNVHPMLYECLSIGFAALFGADFALTEASLSSLLKNVENYKKEFNRRAEATYINLASTPRRIGEGMSLARETVTEGMANARETVTEGMANAKETLAEGMTNAKESVADGADRIRNLTDSYVSRMNPNQLRILTNIEKFKTKEKEEEKKILGLSPLEHLKKSMKMK